jgi:hypothetical protein
MNLTKLWEMHQNYIEVLSHPDQNDYHQENKQQMLMRTLGVGGRYPYMLLVKI